MATYLNGNQDYIPQIQPFKPDYNFLGNVLQTKQSKYDSAKKKISDIYGSILYAPLSREDNILRRDEFFKAIDQDIKKISGLDLSLEQNVDQASKVFEGFFEDKHMFNDMVKTKRHFSELDKAENSKYCYDQDKCGGTYNPLSVQKLQYKMKEFKKVSADESLNFDLGSYDSYYNWQKDAIKVAKESGINVTRESPTGPWIIKDKNGKLIETTLYSLFKGVYGDDSRVAANYETQAYVARKNAIKSTASLYGSEELAENAYLEKAMNDGVKIIKKNISHISTASDLLNDRILYLENKNGALTDEQAAELEANYAQKETYDNYKKGLDDRLASVTADMDQGNIEALRRKADTAASSAFEEADMVRTAEVLSHRDEEHTIKEDPYKMAAYNQSLAKDLESFKDVIGRKRDVWQNELNKELKFYEAQVAAGKVPGVTPDSNVMSVEGPVGGTNSLNAYGNPDVVYMKKADEAIAASTASHSDSNKVLWNAFDAARNSGGIGATNYLNTLYGKGKWENVQSSEQLAALTKGNPYVFMQRAVDYLKEPKNSTGDWGRNVLNTNAELIGKADEKSNSFNATISGFKKGVKETADNLAYNPDFRYANKMLNEYGMISRDEKPTQAFIKAYVKDHPGADFDDIEDSYHAHVSEFFEQYNKKNGAGITNANGLSYSGVDAADRSNKNNKQVNTEILDILNQAYAKPGSFKALMGNASATNFASAKESDPGVTAFFNQFRMDMTKATLKDAKRPIYNVVANRISADALDQSSFTIIPSKEYIDQYMAQNKDKPGLISESILSEGATFFFNNKLIDSKFVSAGGITDMENILTNLGGTKITTYADYAGVLDVKYDKFSGKTTIYPILKRNPIDGPMYNIKSSPLVINDIRDVQDGINGLNLELQRISMQNQQIDEQKALLNQQKSH